MTAFPKNFKTIGFSIAVLLAAALFFFACKKSPQAQTSGAFQTAAATQTGTPAKSAAKTPKLYRCPMHPTFTSDKPGSCGICGMDLVPVEEEKAAPAAAPAAQSASAANPAQPTPKKKIMYRSTMIPNEVSDKPGKDSMGMDMVPFEVEVPSQTQPSAPQAKKKIMYRSTMNPNEISDHPGKDSMGMEMVPFEVEEGGGQVVGGLTTVRISPERQQTIGVTFAEVKAREIHRLIRTVGHVDYVEPAVSVVSLKYEGWIERLFVDETGKLVSAGDPLFEIYSPELVSAQQEYLLAVRAIATLGTGTSLLKSAREKLSLWDITDRQVEELGRTGQVRRTLMVYSPRGGFVIEKNVLLGQKIMAGESLYKIADLSRVWIYGDIYEYELPFIRKGQDVVIGLSYFPGEIFKGIIAYIYPYLNSETRTVRVRVDVPNAGFRMKPGMYANLSIHVMYGTRLAVPADAVLDSGTRKIVFVDKGDGYLEPREIKAGVQGEGFYEVLEGVTAGERVVTSANFLVDSESSLKAALQQMVQPPAAEPRHD
jgi:multidrug efflux pump subunit AcrA (membrane-fusion protein)